MKKANIQTTTYEVTGNFRVDIAVNGNHVEAWIYNTEYGIKSLIIGVDLQKNNQTMEDFMAMVEDSLDEQIEFYNEEYAY